MSLLPGANKAPASPFHGMATRQFGEARQLFCQLMSVARPWRVAGTVACVAR